MLTISYKYLGCSKRPCMWLAIVCIVLLLCLPLRSMIGQIGEETGGIGGTGVAIETGGIGGLIIGIEA